MTRIALDAGHGLGTAGKRLPKALDPKETREWVLNDRIVRYIMAELKKYEGVELLRLDDPTGKVDVPLIERTTLANNWKADFGISVHHNAFKGMPWEGGGVVVYAHPNASAESKRMQGLLYEELVKETKLKGNRSTGTPTSNLHMLRESKMPFVLSENGFMDSMVDSKIILTDLFAKQAAKAHVNAVVKYFDLKLVPEVVVPQKPVDTTLYRVQVGAYRVAANAQAMEKSLKSDGFATYMIQDKEGIYRVQTGAFSVRANALTLESQLKAKGYSTYITTNAVNDAAKDDEVVKETEQGKVEVQEPKPSAPAQKKVMQITNKEVVKNGSKGEGVKQLQLALARLNFLTDNIDGIAGARTVAGIKAFQKSVGLKTDGIAGADTYKKVNEALAKLADVKGPVRYQVGNTYIEEVNPLDLRLSVHDKVATTIPLANIMSAGYQMMQENGKVAPLGILASDGKIISNKQPHKKPAGTFLVYNDGTVAVKELLNLNEEKNLRFAVSGCGMTPTVNMVSGGFVGVFSDIGRLTKRPMIGFNPTTGKVILAASTSATIHQGNTLMTSLGCSHAITLDAGSTTFYRTGGRTLISTTTQLYAVLTW